MDKRQGKISNVRLFGAAIITWLCVVFTAVPVCGAQAGVVSTVVSDGYIYIYLRGISELQEGTVIQIGKEACPREDVAVGSMDSLETPMRTILLVDNSKSIPEHNHQDIQAILKSIVAGAMEREQIKIGIISDRLTYQCEFTSDKEALQGIIEGITYSNQDTYLSDILYDVIDGLEKENAGILTRIVIFADGADDKAIGYTNEEVRGIIGKSSYPVYAVGFPKKNNSAQLETMFSFARASGSGYYLADGTITIEEIAEGLLQDQKNLCVRVRPDESLFDGGSKHIRLKLNTPEGETELTAVVEMPFGEGPEQESETAAAAAEAVEETEREPVKETLPSIAPKKSEPQTEWPEQNGNGPWLYGGLCAAAVVLAAAVLIWPGRRKKNNRKPAAEPEREEGQNGRRRNAEDGEGNSPEDETRLNWEEAPDDAMPLWEKKQHWVTLWNLDRPGISYTAPIEDVIRIGRVGNDINIAEDDTVSKRHCELILRGEILYIKDVGSKNKTKHQDVIVDGETSVASGDTIKVGRSRYRVELIKK